MGYGCKDMIGVYDWIHCVTHSLTHSLTKLNELINADVMNEWFPASDWLNEKTMMMLKEKSDDKNDEDGEEKQQLYSWQWCTASGHGSKI